MNLIRNKIPKSSQPDEPGMMDLIRILHGITWMITQAAAYIREEGVNISRYLGLLQDEKYMEAVLKEDYYNPNRDHEILNSTVVTWQISFELILRNQPDAARLVSRIVMYDRHRIPRDLLENFIEDKVFFDCAAEVLTSFAFIDDDRANDTYSLGDCNKAERLIRLEWGISTQVLGSEHPDTLASVDNLSLILMTQGKNNEAESMLCDLLVRREKVLGAEHPNTLATVDNLALVLQSRGKYAEAVGFFQRERKQYGKQLGPEHPLTLAASQNLRAVLQFLDNPADVDQG